MSIASGLLDKYKSKYTFNESMDSSETKSTDLSSKPNDSTTNKNSSSSGSSSSSKSMTTEDNFDSVVLDSMLSVDSDSQTKSSDSKSNSSKNEADSNSSEDCDPMIEEDDNSDFESKKTEVMDVLQKAMDFVKGCKS